jgi:hypothetical protein
VQWWIPNAAGHRLMVEAAGFAVEGAQARYRIPYGDGHPAKRGRRSMAHSALLARPEL